MQLKIDTISTWEKLLAVFGHRQRGILFRGQSNEKWSLIPSFQRDIPDPNDLGRVMVFEKEVLQRFKTQASTLLPPSIVASLRVKVDWWAVMQHYGVSTRLLDWTHSAFVAAYFAVGGDPKASGAIWSVDVDRVRQIHQHPSSDRIDSELNDVDQTLVYFPEPAIETDRMSVQQTAFSVATRVMQEGHELWLGALLDNVDVDPSRPLAFGKWVIPADAKHKFRDQLRQMNITPASLFPGIDGLGRSFAERIQDRFLADRAVTNRTADDAPLIPW